jgi:hypothetical protein
MRYIYILIFLFGGLNCVAIPNTRYCATPAEIQQALNDAATQPISRIVLTESRYDAFNYVMPVSFAITPGQFILDGQGASILPQANFTGKHFVRKAPDQQTVTTQMQGLSLIVLNLNIYSGAAAFDIDAVTHAEFSHCNFYYQDTCVIGRFCINTKFDQCRFINFRYVGSYLGAGNWQKWDATCSCWKTVPSSESSSNLPLFSQCEYYLLNGATAGPVLVNAEMGYLNQTTVQSGKDNYPKYDIIVINSNTIAKSVKLFNTWSENYPDSAIIKSETAGGLTQVDGVTFKTDRPITLIDAKRLGGNNDLYISGIGYYSGNLTLKADPNIRVGFEYCPNNMRPESASLWKDGVIPNYWSFDGMQEERWTTKTITGPVNYLSGIKSQSEEVAQIKAWKNNVVYSKDQIVLYGTTIYKKATSTQTVVSSGIYKNPPDGTNWVIFYKK